MQAHATFSIDPWDEQPGERIPGGHDLSRATVRRTFRGDLEGTSAAGLLMSKGEDGSAACVAMERIEARLAGRTGTFVHMHAAIADAGGRHGDWRVVPGPATGGLEGLSGRAEYRHDEAGATFTMDYALEGSEAG